MANEVWYNDCLLCVGDKIRVYQKIKERDKFRSQVFAGILIKIAGVGENKSLTVRKIAAGGIGVERIWPLASPLIEKIKRVSPGRVRRAKLYYLRKKALGKIRTNERKKRVGETGRGKGGSLPSQESLSSS